MNIEKLKKLIIKKCANLSFECEQNDRGITMVANASVESYDDSIRIELQLFKSGALGVTFVFDRISRTPETYELINEFNDKVPYLKAFITKRNDKDWLSIEYAVGDVIDEKNGLDIFASILGLLISDSAVKYLKPLTDITTN